MSVESEQSLALRVPSLEGEASLREAGEVLMAFLDDTGMGGRHQRGQVLGVLARHAVAGGVPQSLLPTAHLKEVVAPGNTKEPSAWMSPLWRQLLSEEPNWQAGLQETGRRLGKDYLPRLARADEPSTAKYGVEAVPLPIAYNNPVGEAMSELPQHGVRYTTEQSIEPAAWLRWWMRGGTTRWSLGLRLAVTGWGLAGLALILVLLLVAYARAVTALGPVTFGDLWLLVTLGLVGWIMWLENRYWTALLDLRIVVAPIIVTRLRDHGMTLELRRAEREEEDGQLVLSKYTAACALCSGTVEIADGGRAFPDRLVGRCRRSPREHVFSFDPVRRIGAPLQ